MAERSMSRRGSDVAGLSTMPSQAPNDIVPAFQKNLDALGRTSPALHHLLSEILAINGVDARVFVSTDANAHLYAGKDFLLRIVFTRSSELQFGPQTEKAIYADASKGRASDFFRDIIDLAIKHTGFKSKWADLDRVKNVLTLRAGVPEAFTRGVVAAVREAVADEAPAPHATPPAP